MPFFTFSAKYQNVLKECFRCKNIINKTNLGKFTAHCDQSMKLFCSASCLEEKMNEESVRCLISNTPGQGFYEPLGDKGLVKFFARRECYDEFYQLKVILKS